MSDADTLERLMRARQSCRGFLPQPLDPAIIARVLTMAQQTASWCNAQPWQVTVLSGNSIERFRRALSAHARQSAPSPDIPFPAEYRGIYRDRRRDCAAQLYEAVGVTMGDRVASARQAAKNFSLFDAPHVAIVTTDAALGTYGAVDCGAYVGAFLLAATSLGVATIAQAAIASQAGLLRAHLSIPQDRLVVCGISFGLADPDHPANHFRTSRASLSEAVAHHNETGKTT